MTRLFKLGFLIPAILGNLLACSMAYLSSAHIAMGIAALNKPPVRVLEFFQLMADFHVFGILCVGGLALIAVAHRRKCEHALELVIIVNLLIWILVLGFGLVAASTQLIPQWHS